MIQVDIQDKILSTLPQWIIAFLLGIFICVAIYRGCTSDEFTFFGIYKCKTDSKKTALIKQLGEEVNHLGSVAPVLRTIVEEFISAREHKNVNRTRAQLDNVYKLILDATTQLVRVNGQKRASILLPEIRNGRTVLAYAYTCSHRSNRERSFDENTVAYRVFESGKTYYCKNIADDYSYQASPHASGSYQSFVCVPIKSAGSNTIGVLQIDSRSPEAFSKDDIFMLESIAVFAALVWQEYIMVTYRQEVATDGSSRKEINS